LKNEHLKAAIIGLGKMGLLHACILKVMPNIDVVALCDKGALIRKVCGKLFPGILIADDVAKLSRQALDIVYVTTPIPSHFFIVKTIYSENIAKNVFCEKTLASDHERAIQLCELAQKSKGANMVGFMKRFGVTFLKTKSLLDQRMLGDVVSFDAYAFSSDFVESTGNQPASGGRGGVLGDLGSHVIDLAFWFFGDLDVESASLLPKGGVAEDAVTFDVKGSSSLIGRFDVSWCKKDYRMPEFGFRIQGTKGVIDVNDDAVKLEIGEEESRRWFKHDLGDSVGFLVGGPEYYREDAHFIECAMRNSIAEPSFNTAAKVDYLIGRVKSEATKK
jgi:predicted dehydrogenase